MSLFLSRDELPNVCYLTDTQPSVYVLSMRPRARQDEYHACKIGMSKNPWGRAAHQQSLLGLGWVCIVELVVPCRNPEEVEAAAHRAMAHCHLEREWFNCSIEEAEAAVFAAVGLQ